MTETLRQIGDRLSTDKGAHGYLEAYEVLFQQWRHRPCTVMEIGVDEGRSLPMWERWFSVASIVGIDIEPRCAAHATDRTRVYIGNQADDAFLTGVARECRPLAIVVDDGSHIGTDQVASFRALWPHLVDGGLYAIEDLEACWLPRYEPSSAPFFRALFDSVNHRGTVERVRRVTLQKGLCVIEKGISTEGDR